ncbi:MAG TPA: alpha/beta hydrolase-fold protein, partial [Polyangiaceae bacterium]|nr:alpha/beta hydrolase-fold protein [Polyangiaceae bacterium]
MRNLLALVMAWVAISWTVVARADLIIRPGPQGGLGTWLVAGPLFGTEKAMRFSGEQEIVLGATVMPGRDFRLLQAPDGQFDLQRELRAPSQAFALFGAVLRASSPTRVLLILGADDGVRVTVDDRVVLDKDLWRPPLHDDDAVAFDLSPGDHPLLIRLRQRSGPWKLSARLLDASNMAPCRTVQFVLPGASLDRVDESKLVQVDVGLDSFSDRYEPWVHVMAQGGLPEGVELDVHASVVKTPPKSGEVLVFTSFLGKLAARGHRVHGLKARLLPLFAEGLMADAADDTTEHPFEVRVRVGARETRVRRQGHAQIRRALGQIDRALLQMREHTHEPQEAEVVASTLALSRERLAKYVSEGDDDLAATVDEAKAASTVARHVLDKQDPLPLIRGPMRLAYPSPLDGKNRPFGVYVPPSWQEGKTYPLVVVLHGLNGLPMQMIRIYFGQDHPWRRAPWEDRHVGSLAPLDAFVVSPSGFGNIGYREFGEMDVMHLVQWMKRTYPIDPNRVYVTGLSMGGTGAGAIGLRYADQFAAAAPLCGYHSYALRNDMANRELRGWEKMLAAFWSNVSWAERGKNLPMYVVHGKQDKPVENSLMLIDRYRELGYSMLAEHPDVGHNVWQQTYEGFKAHRWLVQHKRVEEPAQVVLTTASLRYGDLSWVHVKQLERHLQWGRVHARLQRERIDVRTEGVRSLALDWPKSIDASVSELTVAIDGQSLGFARGSPVVMHKDGDRWQSGAPEQSGLRKERGLSGPIHDAFLEPLVFVVGTRDPRLTNANLQVARALSFPPFGVEA